MFTNSTISLKQVYSYRVSTIFPGPIYSPPGPAASAPSVAVSWLPVTGADGYAVVPTTAGITATPVQTASIRFNPLRPKATYGLCVSSIYPPNIRDDAVKNCITLRL